MPAAKDKTALTYQIKVTLRGIEPPIWRRLRVPGSIRLVRLHEVLQIAMGWSNSHLHLFEKDGVHYCRPSDFDPDEVPPIDESKTSLQSVLREVGEQMVYQYDFGDNWEHDVELEKILTSAGATDSPICLDGARHCPPEDVGGVTGYEEFLEAIFDPTHEDCQQMLEWAGGRFQPEEFDLQAVNAALAASRRFK
jgi:hypothetical protein